MNAMPDPESSLDQRLHPGQAGLVRLIHREGFSIAEAGQILGINPSYGASPLPAGRSRTLGCGNDNASHAAHGP